MGFFTFLRSNARLAAFGFAFCLLSSAGQTYFISLFGGELRAEFGLSHGGFGTVYWRAHWRVPPRSSYWDA